MIKENNHSLNLLKLIGVSSLIIYHSNVFIYGRQFASGGFFGIDLIFIISGYLSYIFFKQSSFSFKDTFILFFKQKFRKIFPSLLSLITICFILSWFTLSPDDFVNFAKSVISNLSFNSNFYYHFSGNTLGEYNSLLKPLFHLWSVSVLFQLWIIFIICLVLIDRYFKKYTFQFLAFICLASFVFSMILSKTNHSLNFFIPLTRSWEFILGSIIAYFHQENKFTSQKLGFIENIILYLGFILLFYSIFFVTDSILHPSFKTIIPLLGASIIILFSKKNHFLINSVIIKFFSKISLLSFSLFLFHYPIFAFTRNSGIAENNNFINLLVILSILSLSLINFFILEKKIYEKKFNFKIFSNSILFIIVSVFVLTVSTIVNNGFSERMPEIVKLNSGKESPASMLKNKDNELCFNNLNHCEFNKQGSIKIFAVGDSHMSALAYGLRETIDENNIYLKTFIYGNCIYFPGFDKFFLKTNEISNKCLDSYFKSIEEELLKNKNSITIFNGRFPLYLTKKYYNNLEGGVEGAAWYHKYEPIKDSQFKNIEESFIYSLKKLSNNGNKIILIYPTPEAGWNIPKEVFSKFFIFKKEFSKENYITTSYENYKQRVKSTYKLLDSINGDNIYRIYPEKLFCNTLIKGRCLTHDSKNLFYSDEHHPSLYIIEQLANQTIQKINFIFN